MRVHFVPDTKTLAGTLYYAEQESSFTFEVDHPAVPPKHATPSIILGSLEIEVASESGTLLYVSGYAPREVWRQALCLRAWRHPDRPDWR